MTKRIVILGSGTGGTIAANRLDRLMGDSVEITVVDRDDRHLYQPGLLFIPFNDEQPQNLTRSRRGLLRDRVRFLQDEVESIDPASRTVRLARQSLEYDVLVVASGSRLTPEETEGLTGAGWNERVFTFYNPEGAMALQRALKEFHQGRLVVNIVDMPIKCPVAPLEFLFLADWYFEKRGIRKDVELALATPLDGAFTKPTCNRELQGLLAAKGITVETEFNTGQVEGGEGHLIAFDGRTLDFDLAVVIPTHSGAEFIDRSGGIGDELGFVHTNPHTLQAVDHPDIFVIGDAAGLPTSKAGSVAHFEGEVLSRNVDSHLKGKPLAAAFDGHSNCFIETGHSKAILIDFNYDVEPGLGHFPNRFGLPLLKESRLNHVAKLMFEWVYWHELLPGRELPGIGADMPTAGKRRSSIQSAKDQ